MSMEAHSVDAGPEGQAPKAAQRREHLLNAAACCIGRLGYQKSTMEEIALEAGVSRVTVYREFGNRKSLVEALSARRLAVFNATFMAGEPRYESLAAALEAYLVASTRAARENPITRQIVRGSLAFTRTGSPMHTIMRTMWEPLIYTTLSRDSSTSPIDIDGMVEWIMVMQHTLSRLVVETNLAENRVTNIVRNFIAPAFIAR